MAEKNENAGPVERVAVTGRPADVAPPNTTFADRVKGRKSSKRVASEDVEDKAVKSATSKSVGKQK